MPVCFTQRLRATPSVLVQEIRGELMFLNMGSEAYFGLDAVGSRMYRELTTAESIEAAFANLLDEYDVDEARLRGDMTDLIDKLLDSGLVQIDDT